ncbi:right-handed parallel beta-helix repeat-containing protein [Puia dinghuensis]|uniref:Right handed beta helix domain-containing protein n=1 Tax=Puia dinghuensis TaxID=1792502 RepID=A0A8J2XSE3_9BACT|nr:right-handed parallel beta-helix repeat-containing protein [Puia dinghuensis]GGA90696.1 hypothetical protein GCM10011511_12480 [Puia dinghuensis]
MKTALFAMIVTLLMSVRAAATTWYVKPGGTGTGSGSWANAAASTQLATIIAGAASGDQVWVVGSGSGTTYYPTTGTSRTISFVLKSGVAVYGGFAGTETLLSQRNAATNITILSGDIGIVGNSTDNTYNVVVSTGNTAGTILDGFTIENGNANGAGQNSTGGGIYNSGTTVTYSNCIITNNVATSTGGGVYNTSSTATFTNCTFSHNSTSSDGGGVYIYNSGTYLFTSCAFDTCTATGNGGGIALNSLSNVPFHYCNFVGNSASATAVDNGGGGFYASSGSGDTLIGCTFSKNSSVSYGGGFLSNGQSSFVMRNTTFSQNNASVFGGGFACASGNTFIVTNTHLSNNVAPSGGGMYIVGGSPSLAYDTLSNNTATASSGNGGGGLYEDVSGANPTISHCWFLGNVTNGSNGAAIWDNSANPDSNTVFQANIAKGAGSNGGAIYHNSQTGSIINCVFVDNSCTGYGGGFYNNATSETMENCTFYNNGATTAGAGIYDAGGGNPKYYGNVTWGNSPDGFAVGAGSTGGFKVKYNDFQAALGFSGGSITGNIASNPLFYNSGNYAGSDGIWATTDDGLHLGNGSPAADADQATIPADDIADVHRPYVGNTYANMGAYEGPAFVLAFSVLDFSATPAGTNSAGLSWSVDANGQIARFQVQRSGDGVTFIAAGTVDASPGQSGYSFVDENAAGRLLYYRLLSVLDDGSEQYSRIVVFARTSSTTGKLAVWPSVGVEGKRTVYIKMMETARCALVVSDASGRPVRQRIAVLVAGDNYLTLDMSGLGAGIYYLSVGGNEGPRQAVLLEKL